MSDHENIPAPGFKTSPWSPIGLATITAVGNDVRSALEEGLRAVLSLTVEPAPTPVATGRSAPIRGEGTDVAILFADLVEDLLGQIAFFGGTLHDVTVDGVLRRDDGGYVGWGHASGTLETSPPGVVPHLLGVPTLHDEATRGVILQATLQRS